MLFMADESVKFKDGHGGSDDANYIGPVQHKDSIKHKIRRSDGKEYLVDGVLISSTNEPNIASVPVTVEQYASELPNLSQEQLYQIAHPEILDDDQRELMGLHCKLNHVPFPTLIRMALAGRINKKFAKLRERVPVCMSCIFGMSHRKPWRSKAAPGSIRKDSETEPGDCISIDQLVSAQAGLIPQMSGYLTNMRIWGATVFVDHVSDYVYVALMRDLTLDETLLAKTSFERHAQDGGVRIKAYRADNGRFADQGFRDAVSGSDQQITYCAVGAHHQNGIVERRIKELTLIGRTLLLHAVRHWPGYITTMMWPFALKEAAYRLNKLSIDQDGCSNEARFFGIDHDIVEPSLFHVFGSPAFVLDARLQSGIAGVPKWEPRSRLGIYVGHSPSHAGSVALVLNPKTGHVSPQFHVVFDDAFSTVPYMDQKQVPPNWASLVEQSRELVKEEQYDLAENWLTNSVQPSDPLTESNKDSPLSQVDLNQGLDTEPANNPDALSSPVDVNKSLNTESRASEEVSNASQRETSAQQVQQVQQYVPEDQVSTEDGKDERHVSFNLDNPSTIGAQISTQNEPPKLPDTSNVNPSVLNPSPTATSMVLV